MYKLRQWKAAATFRVSLHEEATGVCEQYLYTEGLTRGEEYQLKFSVTSNNNNNNNF